MTSSFSNIYKFSNQIKNSIINQYSTLIHEQNSQPYLSEHKEEFQKYYNKDPKDESVKIVGFATPQGTLKYSQRKPNFVNEKHFKMPFNSKLSISTIGIGSYVGDPNENDDLKLFNAIIDSVRSGGVNHIDTAINYRYMKSQRVIGAALKYLIEKQEFSRNQFFISSKNGYIPQDADNGVPGIILFNQLVQQKLLKEEDIIGACHCMHPEFLKNQLQQSLNNLGIETLDLMYLHNAAQSQMPLIGEQKFFSKLGIAFEYLENACQLGQIKNYGLASWVCFRSPQDEIKIHLNLQKVLKVAERVGGKDHKLKFIQIPMNIMMAEAFAEKWQDWENLDGKIEKITVLQAARYASINVISSSPLMQGYLIQVPLSSEVFKASNLGAKHLQFVRSIPAQALLSTLVGHKTNRHVQMNLEIIQHAPLTEQEFKQFLKPTQRQQKPEQSVGDIE